ncbi:SGNH/GDSL hydrolase family protein [Sphingomonas sp. KC8]|uniref:SGNH/GDSL hydrolase family protein n=1 Tax=Sphingomonas sp. KC8 TaxID=1030157 RepID=UPI0002489BB8|nr:SGNH/GDSL hydrolase family protein [Sphingomonas sp. KC8]ARS29113.1 hypothetical protein KC8_17725 [Sphingomonas sp. KC8]
MPSTKISALAPASALGGSELLPAVQAGGNVAVTPAQLRAHALAGVPPLLARPMARLMMEGDSKTFEPVSAAYWVNARTPIDVWIGSHDFGVGGSTTGTQATTGLTNPARLAAMRAAVSAAVATGSTVDMLLTIGTNDIVLSGFAPETVLANLRKYHDAFRAAGGRFLIVMNVDPRTGLDGPTARKLIALNRGYADYAASVADAIYCDSAGWWLDPASGNTSYTPTGGATGAAFSMAADGLHGNAFGAYRKQYALAPILQALYRPRQRGPLYLGDDYDVANAPRGNILGANGRTVSLGGTSSITNGGTGTISGTPPLGWTAYGALSGTLSVGFTVATCGALESHAGSTGWQAVRITFSGTPTSNGDMNVRRNVLLDPLGTMPMRASALMACNALAGCAGIYAATVNVSPSTLVYLGSNAATASLVAADRLPQLDGLHEIDFPVVPTGNSNSGVMIGIRWLAGVPMSGSIDLIGASWRRADPIPNAAA